MYKYVAKLLPASLRDGYHDLLRYNDVKIDYDSLVGFVLLFGLASSFTLAFSAALFFSLSLGAFIIFFLVLFLLSQILVRTWLVLAADGRGKFVESILPDALQLMAMNLKAGMTADRALLLAARIEFGPLEKGLSKVGKQVLSGKDIKLALLEIPTTIKSETLDRTIRLIVQGIESGGELSDLLEQTANDIQNTRLIQQEVQANVLMYAIFIFFAAAIGAPLLFGISTYLVEVLSRQMSQVHISSTALTTLKLAQGSVAVSPQFLMMFTISSLTVTSIFGGLIIGVVKKGESKHGAKYIPILLLISLAVFFFIRTIVGGLLTGL